MTITRGAVKSWPILVFTAVLLGYGAVALFGWTASALSDGSYDNAAVGLLGIVFVSVALFLTVGVAAPVLRPGVTSGERGLDFAPSRAVRVAGVVAVLSVLLWGALAGLLKVMGRLRVSGSSYVITALPLIGLACAGVIVWILLHRSTFRGNRFTVTLNPEGIAGLDYGAAAPVGWADIADVAEVNGVVMGLPIGLAHLVVRTGDGAAYPVHQSQFCGGPMLTDAVRFYWHNAEHRAELTTASAAERSPRYRV